MISGYYIQGVTTQQYQKKNNASAIISTLLGEIKNKRDFDDAYSSL